MMETDYCFTSLCKIAKITFCHLMKRLFFDELESTYKKKNPTQTFGFTDNSVVFHAAVDSLQDQENFFIP